MLQLQQQPNAHLLPQLHNHEGNLQRLGLKETLRRAKRNLQRRAVISATWWATAKATGFSSSLKSFAMART